MAAKTNQQKLPIFLISGKSPARNPGGYAAYAHNLAKVFIELGHPVHIIAQGPEASRETTDIGEEHIVSSPLVNKLSFVKSIELAALPLFSPLFSNEVAKIVKEKGYRNFVVWGMGPWSYAGVAIKNKFGKRAKFIAFYPTTFLHEMKGSYDAIRISDYGFKMKLKYFVVVQIISRLYGLLEAQTVKWADLITLNYKYPESFLMEQFGIGREKFRQMSYYVEVFKRKTPSEISEKELRDVFQKHKTLILVCRQDPRKGINFLLHAFKIVARRVKGVKLVVVGSGTMLQPNKAVANKLGISRDVVFTGFVADFEPLLKKADVFVFPAIEEGSGSLSVLEAMKFGKAMVVTDCDGIPEDVQDGKSGIVVPMMDPQALAEGLTKLLKDLKLAKILGNNAKKRYEEKYSLELMKRDTQRILQEVSRA